MRDQNPQHDASFPGWLIQYFDCIRVGNLDLRSKLHVQHAPDTQLVTGQGLDRKTCFVKYLQRRFQNRDRKVAIATQPEIDVGPVARRGNAEGTARDHHAGAVATTEGVRAGGIDLGCGFLRPDALAIVTRQCFRSAQRRQAWQGRGDTDAGEARPEQLLRNAVLLPRSKHNRGRSAPAVWLAGKGMDCDICANQPLLQHSLRRTARRRFNA